MLDIKKIAIIPAYGDEWLRKRLGKITASNFGKLISETSENGKFSSGAITYLDGIIWEIATKKPAKNPFNTESTDRGNALELEAVQYLSKQLGKPLLRGVDTGDTHRFIEVDDLFACTPDALICLADEKNLFDETGKFLKVAPAEVKCPAVPTQFMKLYKCKTPEELKVAEKLYYWQAITQLVGCDSLNGWFGIYHPEAPVKMRVIEFKKRDLIEDIKVHKKTLYHAKEYIRKELAAFNF